MRWQAVVALAVLVAGAVAAAVYGQAEVASALGGGAVLQLLGPARGGK